MEYFHICIKCYAEEFAKDPVEYLKFAAKHTDMLEADKITIKPMKDRTKTINVHLDDDTVCEVCGEVCRPGEKI